jgi:hypothetical protein
MRISPEAVGIPDRRVRIIAQSRHDGRLSEEIPWRPSLRA